MTMRKGLATLGFALTGLLTGCAAVSDRLDIAAAQVASLPPKTWVMAVRGVVLPHSPHDLAVITVTGGPLEAPLTAPGVTPRPLVLDGPANTPLPPKGELVIQVRDSAGLRQATVPLAELYHDPLLGYLDMTVGRDFVEVRVSRYVIGRGIDRETGNIYRKTMPLADRSYPLKRVE